MSVQLISELDSIHKALSDIDKRLLIVATELMEALKPSHNISVMSLPTIEECYNVIPFPDDEHECAMFVAGIAECHKFISSRQRT